jgi:hypothetical protein
MDLQEVLLVDMDWTAPAQNRDSWRALVSVEMRCRVPQGAVNLLTS